MEYATFSVEFSFNNNMYRQIDRVAMGLPLGPVLDSFFSQIANRFEKKLFSRIAKLQIYFRYVDNTFVIFNHVAEMGEFLIMLNNLYLSLKFIFEKEMDKQLPFLDVYVERCNHLFETKVCRKPIIIGQYIR